MGITPYGNNNSKTESIILSPLTPAETAAQAALQLAIPIASNILQNYINRQLTIRIGEDPPEQNRPLNMDDGPTPTLNNPIVKSWDFYNLGKSITEGVLDVLDHSNILETLSSSISKIWTQKGLPCLLTYYLAKHLTPLACDYIAKSSNSPNIQSQSPIQKRPPPLVQKCQSLFYAEAKAKQPVHNSILSRTIDRIVRSVKTARISGVYLPNILIYGSPGTGKTLTAQSIIKETQANYISLSGTELSQWIDEKEHISKIDELFNAAAAESKPTILLIDGADEAFKKRNLSDKGHIDLLDAFLYRTGTPSEKIMIILIAGQSDQIDPRLLSRMSYIIKTTIPEIEERRAIIEQNVDRLCQEGRVLFCENTVQSIARKTQGLSGRDMLHLMDQLTLAQMHNSDNEGLTENEIGDMLEEFIASRPHIKMKM